MGVVRIIEASQFTLSLGRKLDDVTNFKNTGWPKEGWLTSHEHRQDVDFTCQPTKDGSLETSSLIRTVNVTSPQ